MMDKSNHRITVDREYLEELERIAEQHSQILDAKKEDKVKYHDVIIPFSESNEKALTMFLPNNKHLRTYDPSVSHIIIVDSDEGKQLAVYKKIESSLDTNL